MSCLESVLYHFLHDFCKVYRFCPRLSNVKMVKKILIHMPIVLLSGLKKNGKCLINISYCYYGESDIDSRKSRTQCSPANPFSFHFIRT